MVDAPGFRKLVQWQVVDIRQLATQQFRALLVGPHLRGRSFGDGDRVTHGVEDGPELRLAGGPFVLQAGKFLERGQRLETLGLLFLLRDRGDP